jgi:hypothetical protein
MCASDDVTIGEHASTCAPRLGGQAAWSSTCTYAVKVVMSPMILNFADKTSEDIFHGLDSKPARRIPQVVRKIAIRKLDAECGRRPARFENPTRELSESAKRRLVGISFNTSKRSISRCFQMDRGQRERCSNHGLSLGHTPCFRRTASRLIRVKSCSRSS